MSSHHIEFWPAIVQNLRCPFAVCCGHRFAYVVRPIRRFHQECFFLVVNGQVGFEFVGCTLRLVYSAWKDRVTSRNRHKQRQRKRQVEKRRTTQTRNNRPQKHNVRQSRCIPGSQRSPPPWTSKKPWILTRQSFMCPSLSKCKTT